MSKIVIFGAGMRARELKYLLRIEQNIETDFFVVDRMYKDADLFDGTPVIATEDFFLKCKPDETEVYLGIGMPRMNRIRERLFERFHAQGFKFSKFISKNSIVLTDCIGEGCTIFSGCSIGPNVKIGAGNHAEMGVVISHDCVIGDYNFFAPGAVLCGDIKVKNGCFFGANCTVKNSIVVSDYTLVGAGAFLSSNTSEFDVVLPARSVVLPDKKSCDFMG